MSNKNNHVCPASHAWVLDNPVRKLFQKPKKIIGDFVQTGMKVIDLGCGPGYFTLVMAGMVGSSGKILAVDLQQEMLSKLERKAKRKGLIDRIDFHKCREGSLDLFDQKEVFDFALLYYMIHETPNPDRLLKELFPMMKNRSKILVVDPAFHVREEVFIRTLKQAQEIGYQVDYRGKQRGGWCAVLWPTP